MILRLIFAGLITFLLAIPFIQVVGGLLLVWIAWKLVHDEEPEEGKIEAGQNVWQAIRIIIVADAVMSLDNVIALVQAARIDGQVSASLLVIGLATTIPLVIFGAALLTSLLDRSAAEWRNAIAHQDFDPVAPGGIPTLHLARVRTVQLGRHAGSLF